MDFSHPFLSLLWVLVLRHPLQNLCLSTASHLLFPRQNNLSTFFFPPWPHFLDHGWLFLLLSGSAPTGTSSGWGLQLKVGSLFLEDRFLPKLRYCSHCSSSGVNVNSAGTEAMWSAVFFRPFISEAMATFFKIPRTKWQACALKSNAFISLSKLNILVRVFWFLLLLFGWFWVCFLIVIFTTETNGQEMVVQMLQILLPSQVGRLHQSYWK